MPPKPQATTRQAAPSWLSCTLTPSIAARKSASFVLDTYANDKPSWSPLHRYLLFFTDRFGHRKLTWTSFARLGFPPPRWRILPHHVHTAFLVRNRTALLLHHERNHLSVCDFPIPRSCKKVKGPWGSIQQIFPPVRNGSVVWLEETNTEGDHELLELSLTDNQTKVRRRVPLPESTRVAELGPLGQRALLRRAAPPETLQLLDLAGLSRTRIPVPGKVLSAEFADYGRKVIIASRVPASGTIAISSWAHRSNETSLLRELDANTDLKQMHISANGRWIVLLISQEHQSRLLSLNGGSGDPLCRVSLPPGTGTLGPLTGTSAHVPLAWETPTHPRDLLSFDARHCRLKRLRHDERPRLAAMPSVKLSFAPLAPPDHAWVQTLAPDIPPTISSETVPAAKTSTSNHTKQLSPSNDSYIILLRPEASPKWDPIALWYTSRGVTVVKPSGANPIVTPELVKVLVRWLKNRHALPRSTTWLVSNKTTMDIVMQRATEETHAVIVAPHVLGDTAETQPPGSTPDFHQSPSNSLSRATLMFHWKPKGSHDEESVPFLAGKWQGTLSGNDATPEEMAASTSIIAEMSFDCAPEDKQP